MSFGSGFWEVMVSGRRWEFLPRKGLVIGMGGLEGVDR